MIKSNIRWKAFSRDALPDALFGISSPNSAARYSFERYDLMGDNVVAGFSDSRIGADYNPPCIFVIADESAAETFSWLRVYSPETFPLSQFGRVVSVDEWNRFESPDSYPSFQIRHDKWASVIVGEALAQGEADVELAQLPLSRASACFTTAIARATSVHRIDEATRTCADRLRLIEADRRFVRRPVSVTELLPVWAMVGAPLGEALSPQEATEFVLTALEKYLPMGSRPRTAAVANLRGHPELGSDSIEERVLAFQRLASELVHATERGPRNGLPSALLAAAAFMVGRSTSHHFLISRIGGLFPAASVWFGLIAALAGTEAWDPAWTRATKGVERQIRSDFQWTDSSGFDMSWTEFAWLAGTFEGPEIFASLPKLAAKAMSIEIIPGAACQFRFSAGLTSDSELRTSSSTRERERELRAVLAQFVGLATRASGLLEAQSGPGQQSLTFEGESAGKTSKAKRGRHQDK
jgi:hypothetical protein